MVHRLVKWLLQHIPCFHNKNHWYEWGAGLRFEDSFYQCRQHPFDFDVHLNPQLRFWIILSLPHVMIIYIYEFNIAGVPQPNLEYEKVLSSSVDLLSLRFILWLILWPRRSTFPSDARELHLISIDLRSDRQPNGLGLGFQQVAYKTMSCMEPQCLSSVLSLHLQRAQYHFPRRQHSTSSASCCSGLSLTNQMWW